MKKKILIIGANSSITEYQAKYYGEDDVIVTYCHSINNKNYYDNLSNVTIEKLDITNEMEVDNFFQKHNDISVVINNACTYNDNSIFDKNKEEFMKVLEVNLLGTFLVDKYAIKYLNNSIIINMSSTDGIDTYNELNIDYSVSKSGIITLTKSISLVDSSNKVICFVPNWIDTKSTKEADESYINNELKRIGQDRLITVSELTDSINKVLNNDITTGSIYRIDIKEGKLWIQEL